MHARLYDNNCPFNTEEACAKAAMEGQFASLQWLHQNALLASTRIITFAAAGGHLELLKWAVDANYPFDEHTAAFIAALGNIDILKLLHAKGCPW